MNSPRFFSLLGLLLLLATPIKAAILDLRFNPASGTQEDPAYPGISTITFGSSNLPGVVPTLTGRGYGVDESVKDRWGIVAGPLEWNSQKNGWTVRNGFAPDKVGSLHSTEHAEAVGASYLSIMLPGVASGTVFKDVALTFTEVTFLRPSRAWAGTSADDFSRATSLLFSTSRGVQQLSVTLPEFTHHGTEALEIRVYGIIGSDEGAFNVLSVSGTFESPAAIPEPDAKLLISSVLLGALVAFRRRSGALPR